MKYAAFRHILTQFCIARTSAYMVNERYFEKICADSSINFRLAECKATRSLHDVEGTIKFLLCFPL